MTAGADKVGPASDGTTYNRTISGTVTVIDLADPGATGTPTQRRGFEGNWLFTCTAPFLTNSGGPKASDVATPDAAVDADGDEAPPLAKDQVHSFWHTRKKRFVKIVRSGAVDGVLTFWKG